MSMLKQLCELAPHVSTDDMCAGVYNSECYEALKLLPGLVAEVELLNKALEKASGSHYILKEYHDLYFAESPGHPVEYYKELARKDLNANV